MLNIFKKKEEKKFKDLESLKVGDVVLSNRQNGLFRFAADNYILHIVSRTKQNDDICLNYTNDFGVFQANKNNIFELNVRKVLRYKYLPNLEDLIEKINSLIGRIMYSDHHKVSSMGLMGINQRVISTHASKPVLSDFEYLDSVFSLPDTEYNTLNKIHLIPGFEVIFNSREL